MVEVSEVRLVPYSSSVNVIDPAGKLYGDSVETEGMAALQASGVHVAAYRADLDVVYVSYDKPADERLTVAEFEAKFGAAAAALLAPEVTDQVVSAAIATEAAAVKAIQDLLDAQAVATAQAKAEQDAVNAAEEQKLADQQAALEAERGE